jgi:proteasome lid subunit RPN8/RPN11
MTGPADGTEEPKISAVSATHAPMVNSYAPECPFPLECSPAVLEEIRGRAIDAFFSVPHGGAEIGGVLLGKRAGRGVRILASQALECEHAFGPGFTLSEKDHARLQRLLEDTSRDLRAHGLEAVGWYHSHTRSEILLSDTDLEIHNRYFPHAWQVALVVRPHATKPMRAGFFFREADGSMRAECSYTEFSIQPEGRAVFQPPAAEPDSDGPRLVSDAREVPLPGFLAPPTHRRSYTWIWLTAIALSIGAGLFAFRDFWMPVIAHDPPASVSLLAYDFDGQLQIHWNHTANPVRAARSGTLEIADGPAKAVVALDSQRIREGTFSYARATTRVDIHLVLDQPDGKKFEEFTTFLGRPPAAAPEPDDAAQFRNELKNQAARTRELERAIDEMRTQIRREQDGHVSEPQQ